ncbi:MAG TPA: fumarylacetoacetate hydrolase family protein [Acidimicrobiales bacterium]|nr:fumarylacetoacetate hydrolase family protein [Acidimicrobiales bacterium]
MKLIGRAVLGDTSCHGQIEDGRFHVVSGDIFASPRRTGPALPLSDVKLATPIESCRFINVMGGFRMADRPGFADLPPMWLPKATNFPKGDGDEIEIPSVLTGPVQIEAELAVVVGRTLRKASADEARESVFGWTVFNDVTAPEYGNMGFWAVGKSIDGFAAWGPWIRTDLTEERVMDGLAITARVNGEEAQAGNTKTFKFRPSEVLSHVSHRITLFPGDVVALGTPYPAPEAVAGDHVACQVEEVGILNNYFVAEKDAP